MFAKGTSNSRAEHVLIIGIDGLGGAFLERSCHALPRISQLIDHGVSTTRARTVFPSLSAPAWTAVLCAQGPAESGIVSNAWTPEPRWTNPPGEAVLTHSSSQLGTEQADTAYMSGEDMFYKWNPQESAGQAHTNGVLGGEPNAMPSVSGRGRVPESMWTVAKSAWAQSGTEGRASCVLGWDWIRHLCADCDDLCCEKGNEKAVAAMVNFICDARPPQLMFIQLDDVDEAGHAHGWGSDAYCAAMEDADQCVGILIDALERAGISEETLVMVIADHGGVGYDHGGFSQVELFIPFIARGAGISKGIRLPEDAGLSLLDVAPTALHALGIAPGRQMRGRILHEIWAGHPTTYPPTSHGQIPICCKISKNALAFRKTCSCGKCA